MSAIHFIDVTLRDAHQSLWSTRMTNAMLAPWLSNLDGSGFHTIDLVGGAVFDVCVRYLQENPWERMRIVSSKVRRTPINVWMRGQSLFTFEFFADDVVEATIRHIAANGMRHITTYDALNDIRNVEVPIKAARKAGLGVTGAVVYTCSPVHTDAYFAARGRELVDLGVDRVCLKDPSGLLVPERIKTLVPALRQATALLPLELHSHCLSGLAPQVYIEAIEHGATFFHTAISPLAHGASLPPTEYIDAQARARGFTTGLDAAKLQDMAVYFRTLALRERKPLGKPVQCDPRMYEHQVPGGMISNLRTQLRAARIEQRLDEILDEVAQVRKDLGYPIMVSPFAQFLITQATINVVQGERYKTIPDEIRKYALGYYGRAAAPMAPEFLERAVGYEKPFDGRPGELVPPAIPRLKATRGPFADDGHLLLAAYYDDTLIKPVLGSRRDRLPPLRFHTTPLLELVEYLTRRDDFARVSVRLGTLELSAIRR